MPDGVQEVLLVSRSLTFSPVTLLCIVLIAGCTGLLAPEEREIVVSADRLSELLDRRISIDKNFFDVLQVKTSNPKVMLDAQTQRLRIDLDLRVGHPFSSRPLTGHTGISGGLAFDPQTLTVLLTEPQVEKLDLDAVPSGLRDRIAMLSRALGRELLDKYPLVTLEARHFTAHGREYRVIGFDMVPEGLRVLLKARP
jgi:hypothetical protein